MTDMKMMVGRMSAVLLAGTCSFTAFAQGQSLSGTVKDASGEPLIGVSVKVKDGKVFIAFEDFAAEECEPSLLTHQRPVLDADGVPIHEGDTLYGIGRTQHVFVVLGQPGLGGGNGRFKIVCHDVTDGVDCDCDPSLLTHTKPEPPDSWELIEDDATKQPYSYCVERGLDDDALPTNEKFARDLVRRCRALAERGEQE